MPRPSLGKILILALCLSGFSGAGVAAPDNAQQPLRVTQSKHFPWPAQVLRRLVAEVGKRRQNNFCVIGYRLGDGSELAYVYWPDNKEIILWEPLRGAGVARLYLSRRHWDLDKDIVADAQAPGYFGSTYLETRDWERQILDECSRFGEYFTIARSVGTEQERHREVMIWDEIDRATSFIDDFEATGTIDDLWQAADALENIGAGLEGFPALRPDLRQPTLVEWLRILAGLDRLIGQDPGNLADPVRRIDKRATTDVQRFLRKMYRAPEDENECREAIVSIVKNPNRVTALTGDVCK